MNVNGNFNQIKNAINKIGSGSFFRVKYSTFPTLSRSAKDHGIVVEKIVSKTVRTGVNYGNISYVKNKVDVSSDATNKENWFTWLPKCESVKKNTFVVGNKNGNTYLAIMPMKRGCNTISKWFINGKEVSESEVRNSGYVINSYFNSNRVEHIPFQVVNVCNISEISSKNI